MLRFPIFLSTLNFDYFSLYFEKVQNSLIGARVHERVIVTLEPFEAYGDYNDDLIYTVNRTVENENCDPHLGQKLEIELGDGRNKSGIVIFKDYDHLHIDTNHPLAGSKLMFDIFIKNISCVNQKNSTPQALNFEDDFNL